MMLSDGIVTHHSHMRRHGAQQSTALRRKRVNVMVSDGENYGSKCLVPDDG